MQSRLHKMAARRRLLGYFVWERSYCRVFTCMNKVITVSSEADKSVSLFFNCASVTSHLLQRLSAVSPSMLNCRP